jgi:hypothetical protein
MICPASFDDGAAESKHLAEPIRQRFDVGRSFEKGQVAMA